MNRHEKDSVEHLRSKETDDHNEATVSDEKDEGAAQLADLPVADELADETKGGSGPASRDAHFRDSTFGNELMSP